MRIRENTIVGNILATVTQLVDANFGGGLGAWLHFDLPAPIAVTPGNVYVIELETDTFTHAWHTAADPYGGGTRISGGVAGAGDWMFRTYAAAPAIVAAPPPVTLTVTKAVAGAAPEGAAFDFNLDCYGVDATFTLHAGESHQVVMPYGTRCTLTEPGNGGAVSTSGLFTEQQFQGNATITVTNTFAEAVGAPPAPDATLNGELPTIGIGAVTFSGGSVEELRVALLAACPSGAPIFATYAGEFVAFFPTSLLAAPNAGFLALFGAGIPAGTPLVGGNCG
jgi:hypothetical protein